MCRVQYRQTKTKSNVFVSVRFTHHPQQFVNFSTNRLTKIALCKFHYGQTDYEHECGQFNTDKQTTHSNMYSSEPTDRTQKSICSFQYRQTVQTHQFVQFSTERQTKHCNVYSSVRTVRNPQQIFQFSTERKAAHIVHIYVHLSTDRPHRARCRIQY